MLKPAAFLKLLSSVRQSDDALGEALSEIAHYVLTQWHTHGNRTPHLQLRLALDGGVDESGWFGAKNAQLRGVSRGVAILFNGLRKLPARDTEADVEVATQNVVDSGMLTRAEARAESKAKRETNAKKAAKITESAPEPDTTGLLGIIGLVRDGTVIELSAAEFDALAKTLTQLRALQATDGGIIDVQVREVTETRALATV